jgi:hypothetical protein
VANSNRHRPGLVYGPVRPSGPRDRGRVVGNALGLLVVAVSAGLLVVGVYVFLQSQGGNRPISTPSRAPETFAPGSTPGASASFLAVGSLSPSPMPTGLSSPGPTPLPTLYVPEVVTGPGYITFGSNVDGQLRVTDAKTTFAADEPMVWSADLTQPANSTDLKIQIYKLDASQPSGQRLVRTDDVKPDATGAQVYFRRLRPLGAALGSGLFTIDYVRGQDILATGSFLIQ